MSGAVADRIRRLVLCGGGLGLAPFAPGTFGTLGGVVPAVVLGACLDGTPLAMGLAAFAALIFALGCALGGSNKHLFGQDDPGCVVIDEVAGYLVAVAIDASLHGRPGPWTHATAFLVFRAFDVLKLPPARRAEELPGGLGVMADDVVAGVQTAAVLWVLHAVGLP
ncbi:MAG: phosphatidylglycerophosphatase A [Planctomycetes bacterium]|nr:phosphatidylglycerophosphatase A [Planctomycetota bacterium]